MAKRTTINKQILQLHLLDFVLCSRWSVVKQICTFRQQMTLKGLKNETLVPICDILAGCYVLTMSDVVYAVSSAKELTTAPSKVPSHMQSRTASTSHHHPQRTRRTCLSKPRTAVLCPFFAVWCLCAFCHSADGTSCDRCSLTGQQKYLSGTLLACF